MYPEYPPYPPQYGAPPGMQQAGFDHTNAASKEATAEPGTEGEGPKGKLEESDEAKGEDKAQARSGEEKVQTRPGEEKVQTRPGDEKHKAERDKAAMDKQAWYR